MTDEKQRKLFAHNLRMYISASGKQQKEIAEKLGFNQKTLNGWCNALSVPTMGKVQALADYFGIRKSDLLDAHTEEEQTPYYLDDETRELAEFLHKNPRYRVLFDASRKVKPEDIEFVKQMIDRMTD